jgi:hypothetical protein
LLLSRFEIAFVLGLFAHALNGIHQIALLRQKRISQIGRPLEIIRKSLHNIWQAGHCLHARVPGLLRDCIGERLVFQSLVLLEPLLQLNDLQRIC